MARSADGGPGGLLTAPLLGVADASAEGGVPGPAPADPPPAASGQAGSEASIADHPQPQPEPPASADEVLFGQGFYAGLTREQPSWPDPSPAPAVLPHPELRGPTEPAAPEDEILDRSRGGHDQAAFVRSPFPPPSAVDDSSATGSWPPAQASGYEPPADGWPPPGSATAPRRLPPTPGYAPPASHGWPPAAPARPSAPDGWPPAGTPGYAPAAGDGRPPAAPGHVPHTGDGWSPAEASGPWPRAAGRPIAPPPSGHRGGGLARYPAAAESPVGSGLPGDPSVPAPSASPGHSAAPPPTPVSGLFPAASGYPSAVEPAGSGGGPVAFPATAETQASGHAEEPSARTAAAAYPSSPGPSIYPAVPQSFTPLTGPLPVEVPTAWPAAIFPAQSALAGPGPAGDVSTGPVPSGRHAAEGAEPDDARDTGSGGRHASRSSAGADAEPDADLLDGLWSADPPSHRAPRAGPTRADAPEHRSAPADPPAPVPPPGAEPRETVVRTQPPTYEARTAVLPQQQTAAASDGQSQVDDRPAGSTGDGYAGGVYAGAGGSGSGQRGRHATGRGGRRRSGGAKDAGTPAAHAARPGAASTTALPGAAPMGSPIVDPGGIPSAPAGRQHDAAPATGDGRYPTPARPAAPAPSDGRPSVPVAEPRTADRGSSGQPQQQPATHAGHPAGSPQPTARGGYVVAGGGHEPTSQPQPPRLPQHAGGAAGEACPGSAAADGSRRRAETKVLAEFPPSAETSQGVPAADRLAALLLEHQPPATGTPDRTGRAARRATPGGAQQHPRTLLDRMASRKVWPALLALVLTLLVSVFTVFTRPTAKTPKAAAKAPATATAVEGPVVTVRGARGVIVGHSKDTALLRAVAVETDRDVNRVTDLWGTKWARRVIVILPASDAEFTAVTAGHAPESGIAAVALLGEPTAALTPGSDAEALSRAGAGQDRIVLQPTAFRKLSALGRRVVLRHEITHVATKTSTTASTPDWLAEGLAETIGWADSDVKPAAAAPELAAEVRAGRVPTSIPNAKAFTAAGAGLPALYQESWLACQFVVDKVGMANLVRLYQAVGAAPARAAGGPIDRLAGAADARQSAALQFAFAVVLRVSPPLFVHQWRQYVGASLK